jgi:hypothetical protein
MTFCALGAGADTAGIEASFGRGSGDRSTPVCLAANRKLGGGRLLQKRTPRPAIVMTLNHFDGIGCLEKLAKRREHAYLRRRLQMPYLNGSDSYPVPIPQSAAGLGAASSALPDQPVL